jgi:hypothetical protein
MKLLTTSSVALLLSAVSVGQQYTVVPAAYTNTDAISYEWIAGASRPLRQVTLVGSSHMQSMVGQVLTAIDLRRTHANEVYAGGTTDLTVSLSISPNAPLTASTTYADNVGPNPVQVWSGPLTLPTSPATTSASVAWTTDNTLHIPFSTPFLYTGGTLCIDIVGQPVAGQNANWWMADAEFEDVAGSVVQIGAGCGAYGGPTHEWSFASARSLVPGAAARFFAYGPANSFGIVAFGAPNPVGVPLWAIGIPTPNCSFNLSTLDALMLAMFEPQTHPLAAAMGGIAEVRVRIPNDPAVFGLSWATQWLEWSQMASSNTLQWTIASAIPQLDMALVEGHPGETTGELSVHLAHVLRFEHQ